MGDLAIDRAGAVALLPFALVALLWLYSRWRTRVYEIRNPPAGAFATIDGERLHFVLRSAFDGAPTLVFVHGASANLHEPLMAFEDAFGTACSRLYIDRPGHGWSSGGAEVNGFPARQAELVAGLLDHLDIRDAVFVGHSYGAAIVSSLALARADKVAGIVFVAPATHPWPGGTAWYNSVGRAPYAGWLFTRLFALPAAELVFGRAVANVFAPDPVPPGYAGRSAAGLVIRPETFRNNCRDIAGLSRHVTEFSPKYPSIAAPTIIVTGTRDSVVLPGIHSHGLEKAISGSSLIVCEGAGHMPHHSRKDVVVAAIFKILERPAFGAAHRSVGDRSVVADEGDA